MSMTWLANADFDTAWAHIPWTDFRSPSESAPIAVLPVFGFADHGLGLALDVEEVVGSEILHRAVLTARQAFPLKVLPPLRFGLAPYASSFFGVDAETAHDLLQEIAAGVQAAGLQKLVFFVTSPWQKELVHSASRDARVALGLQTFVISLAGLGLDFHPADPHRARAQAMAAHILGTPPGARRPGIPVETGFRPGRWDQPPPVDPDHDFEPERLFDAAGRRLARLLSEVQARAPLGRHDHRPLRDLPEQPSARHPTAPAVWPSYRQRYLPALTRDALESLPDKSKAFVVIPTGSIEQHGPHLPVGVDAILGQAWLEAALPHLPPDTSVWVAPPVTFGKSNEHLGFPGTLTISARTLRRQLLALAAQLKALGFRQIGLLNTHGGNSEVLIYTLREIQTALDLRAGIIGHPFQPPLDEQELRFGFHAGRWETALMLAAASETVRMEHAASEYPANIDDPGELRPEDAPAVVSWMSRDISASGIMGDATRATPEDGRTWLSQAGAALARRIAELAYGTTEGLKG